MTTVLRIATRQSPLALWQANFVKDALIARHPYLQVELVTMTTQGDKILDTPLAKVGGKGLFVKELEQAMLDGRADIAVHSMKDVPTELPEGLILEVICEREDPSDAFVSNHFAALESLPKGSTIGSSSLRRQSQLRHLRPDVVIRDLRGNVGTRLAKLDAGNYDAIILASAGLMRLNLAARISQRLAFTDCLPAGGQGAVGIECRKADQTIMELLKTLHHRDTADCVFAERAMNRRLQGGCQVPIAAYASLNGDQLTLRGRVGDPQGITLLQADINGPRSNAEALGIALAEELLGKGADRILRDLQL